MEKSGNDLVRNVNNIHNNANRYLKLAREIKNDSEQLRSTSFVALYREAERILQYHEKDNCPLCESEIKRELLIEMVVQKIEKLNKVKEKDESLKKEKEELLKLMRSFFNDLKNYKEDASKNGDGLFLQERDFEKIKAFYPK